MMKDSQRVIREEIRAVFTETGIEGVRKFVLEHRSDPNYKNFLPKLDKAAEQGGKQGARDFIQDYLKNPNLQGTEKTHDYTVPERFRTRQGTDVGYAPAKTPVRGVDYPRSVETRRDVDRVREEDMPSNGLIERLNSLARNYKDNKISIREGYTELKKLGDEFEDFKDRFCEIAGDLEIEIEQDMEKTASQTGNPHH